eukprot:TRINITY_DN7752_c0_g3_i1.p1 TRINITY_DN7752_c0_g3~~TRINITY_DN7752_c0_g3_i1.p1  ORF type:complete len:209 (+),score=67.71 TRINITY_DN7752_c0_g3_i1:316-942(+)
MGCCQAREMPEENKAMAMSWCERDAHLQLDDAEMFYESLERTRSRLGSEAGSMSGPSNMSLLSLLGRHNGASDMMAETVDMMWDLRALAAAIERSTSTASLPQSLQHQVAKASRTLTSIGNRLSDCGITVDSPDRNKSFNSVESWRRGVTPSRVTKEDNPLGRSHNKKTLRRALGEVDGLCTELAEHQQHIHTLMKTLKQWSAENRRT